MNRLKAKKNAKMLVKQVDNLSWEALCGFLGQRQWGVIRYTDEQGRELSGQLNLQGYSETQDSFCYCVQGKAKRAKMVCIRAGICETTAAALLLHEIGHIIMGHRLDCLTQKNEDEANLFVQYARGLDRKREQPRGNNNIIITAVLCALSLILGGAAVRYIGIDPTPAQQASAGTSTSLTVSLPSVQPPALPAASSSEASEEPISGEVVLTKTGERYHRPDCQYVRGKDNLRSMSLEEARQAGYTPCKVCRPDEQ